MNVNENTSKYVQTLLRVQISLIQLPSLNEKCSFFFYLKHRRQIGSQQCYEDGHLVSLYYVLMYMCSQRYCFLDVVKQKEKLRSITMEVKQYFLPAMVLSGRHLHYKMSFRFMNWYFGPPHIKGITPPDFNKTNILPTEN